MTGVKVLISSPSLDIEKNVSGISSMTKFIIKNNKHCNYIHFELGRRDDEKRNLFWFIRIIKAWMKWTLIIVSWRSIIHFNFALEKPSVYRDGPLIMFAQFLKKKIIIHIHGGEYLEKNIPPWYLKIILKSILSGREPLIVFSLREKEIIENKFKADNVFVLPNAIEINEAQQFNRSHAFSSPVSLLYIGRIASNKGLEYILEALMILTKNNTRFKFIMAGNGPEKKYYVQNFSRLLGSNFEFMGVVSGATKTELFKRCTIFLLPSLYEGLPISLLETMSFGIVPIVTDVGSVSTVVRNLVNGIIVETKSSVAISEAIETLINETELLKKLGENAKHAVLDQFNPSIYIEKLNEIYKSTLA